MKKYLPYLPRIPLLCGCIGILLRLWLLLVGEDHKALYPAGHISWILLLVLSAAVLAILFLLARFAGKNRFYIPNFPASVPGAVGFVIGSIGLAGAALGSLRSDLGILYTVAGAVGLLAAAALLWGGYCRWQGKKPHYSVFALPCTYFCLRLFCMGHAWGDEPELSRFLFAYFASAACVLSSWQLWAFSVDLGNRPTSLLASLLAVYLCMAAVPGSEDSILYAAMVIWLYTNHCPVTPPPRRCRAVQETPAAPEEPAVQPQEPLDPQIHAILTELFPEAPQKEE